MPQLFSENFLSANLSTQYIKVVELTIEVRPRIRVIYGIPGLRFFLMFHKHEITAEYP